MRATTIGPCVGRLHAPIGSSAAGCSSTSTTRPGRGASTGSYCIKKLEPLYRFERDVELYETSSALASFEAWLQSAGAGGAGRARWWTSTWRRARVPSPLLLLIQTREESLGQSGPLADGEL